jgi:lysophospholipase L1-like esterase
MDTRQPRTPPPAAPNRKRRWWPWLLVSAAVVALAIAGLAAAGAFSVADRVVPGAAGETAPSIGPGDTAAVFLGDSYTEGWGASDPSRRWSALVADEADWVEVNRGQGGTGFVTTAGAGTCRMTECPTYVDRVRDVVDVRPDIVVIAGGQNDIMALDSDPESVRAAVVTTYEEIREGLPQARIIAVGPSMAQPGNELIEKMDGWVQAAAESVGADYVSLIDPVTIKPEMVSEDGVHVNDEGHRAIADRVLRGIRTG